MTKKSSKYLTFLLEKWLQSFSKYVNVNLCFTLWILSRRPQPPALPRQRCGWDPLPDGGRDSWHDITAGDALDPRSAALLAGDYRGAGPQSRPQPGRHRHFQRAAAVETLPQLQPGQRTQGAVRASPPPPATQWLIHFPKERFGLFVLLTINSSQ